MTPSISVDASAQWLLITLSHGVVALLAYGMGVIIGRAMRD